MEIDSPFVIVSIAFFIFVLTLSTQCKPLIILETWTMQSSILSVFLKRNSVIAKAIFLLVSIFDTLIKS